MIDDTVTLGNILGTLGVIASMGGFLWKIKSDNKIESRAVTDEIKQEFKTVEVTLAERIVKLETKIVDFMPRKEIEDKIEHERANRVQNDEALARITDRLSNDVRQIMVGQSKIEQQQQATSGTVGEIKESLKDLSKEMGARFDKISNAISRLSGQPDL